MKTCLSIFFILWYHRNGQRATGTPETLSTSKRTSLPSLPTSDDSRNENSCSQDVSTTSQPSQPWAYLLSAAAELDVTKSWIQVQTPTQIYLYKNVQSSQQLSSNPLTSMRLKEMTVHTWKTTVMKKHPARSLSVNVAAPRKWNAFIRRPVAAGAFAIECAWQCKQICWPAWLSPLD